MQQIGLKRAWTRRDNACIIKDNIHRLAVAWASPEELTTSTFSHVLTYIRYNCAFRQQRLIAQLSLVQHFNTSIPLLRSVTLRSRASRSGPCLRLQQRQHCHGTDRPALPTQSISSHLLACSRASDDLQRASRRATTLSDLRLRRRRASRQHTTR